MFCFFGCKKTSGILASQPGIEPVTPALEGKALSTRPPGKSLPDFYSCVPPKTSSSSALSSPGPSFHHHHYHLSIPFHKLAALLSSWQFYSISLPRMPCEVRTILFLIFRGSGCRWCRIWNSSWITVWVQRVSGLSLASQKTSLCWSHLFEPVDFFVSQHWPVPVLRSNIFSDLLTSLRK